MKAPLRALAAVGGLCLSSIAFSQGGPNHYQEPGFTPGRDYVNQSFAENVDPFTGNLLLNYVDVFIPGNGGFNIKVQRSYNLLKVGRGGVFGEGWDIHFGQIRHAEGAACGTAAPNSLVIELPDGSEQALYKSNAIGGTSVDSDWLTLRLWKAECASTGVGMIAYSPDGTRYEFTKDDITKSRWALEKVTDRNGNVATISYTYLAAADRLVPTSVSAFGQSQIVTLAYNTSAGVLASIASQGRTWNYTVSQSTGVAQLTTVRPPTGGSWEYEYYGDQGSHARSRALMKVTRPQGGAITYDYGTVVFFPGAQTIQPGSVVTSKSSTDGAWSFSYSPSTSTGGYDTTTVTQPGAHGQIVYKHFGYRTVSGGEVWKIGLLAEKGIGTEQTELYTWTSFPISNTTVTRPGYVTTDPVVRRPVPNSTEIIRDGQSYKATYSNHDAFGNPTSIQETGPNSRTRTLAYENKTGSSVWILGLPTTESVSGTSGTVRARSYGSTGNLSTDSRFGVTTTYAYHGDGGVQMRTNARSSSTTYSNYKRGIPQQENRPESVTISRSVDNFGNVLTETDGIGTRTYSYDDLNRLASIDYPIGSRATISWQSDTLRRLTRGPYVDLQEFDSFGRLVSWSQGDIGKDFDYDSLGRKVFESFAESAGGTSFVLDKLGRPTSSTSPHGTRSYMYGSNFTRATNERGQATTLRYYRYGSPDDGHLKEIDSPAGTKVVMTRDTVGTLEAATQDNVTRTYGHDTRKFLTSIVEPETGTTTFGRDAVGNMTSRTIGGRQTLFTYDGLDRNSQITYPSPTGGVALTYNNRSQVKRIAGSAAQRDYEYDNNGNMTEDKVTVDGRSFVVNYAYDAIDGLMMTTYPADMGSVGRTVTYGPDQLGRPVNALPYLTAVTYHESGNLASISFGNGKTMSFGQHPTRLIPNSIVGGGFPLSLSYQYDGVGNVASIADAVTPALNASFAYDGADRLTGATGPWGSGVIDYFGNGNIARKVLGETVTYNYSSNRISNVVAGGQTRTYSYDGYGNTTGNGRNSFAFDDASNLKCADCGTGNEISYAYDGRGWRVWQLKNGLKTYFVHGASGDLLFEYTPVGNQWKKHVYLQGKRVATRSSELVATTTTLMATNNASGELVSLTATVSPSIATGSVLFTSQATSATAQLVNGVATLSADALDAGQHLMTAEYAGDPGHGPSASSPPLSVLVAKRLPVVNMTSAPVSPGVGQAFTVTVAVSGSAGSPTGSVDLIIDGGAAQSGSLAGGSVLFNVAGLAAGPHSLVASYFGDATYKENSKTISMSIGPPNVSPTVSLTSPTGGSVLILDQPVTLAASASDSDGTVSSVTFFDGALEVGSSPGTTFSVPWTPTVVGTHSLTARARDNVGAETTSSPVSVSVACAAGNQPPEVAITYPTSGMILTGPVIVSVAATATDADGAVAKVEFFNGATKIGEDTSDPFVTDWLVGGGPHTITAVATDRCGDPTTSAPVTFTVQQPVAFVNGGFEEPALAPAAQTVTPIPATSGWTFTGPDGYTYMMTSTYLTSSGRPAAPEGVQVGAYRGVSASLLQSIHLVPGEYQVRLHAMYDGGTTAPTAILRRNGQIAGQFVLAKQSWTEFATPSFSIDTAGTFEFELTSSGGTASDFIFVDDVRIVTMNGSVSAAFSPATVGLGEVSVLTVVLTNTSTVPITGASFANTYLAGLVNAAAANGATTCVGGAVAAAAGGTNFALSDATVPALGSCTVTVNVTSPSTGTFLSDTGDVSSNAGGMSGASATLVVGATGSIQFRSSSSRTGSGTLAFPAGSLPSDWLVMYAVSHVAVATPTGWTQSKAFTWSANYGYFSYVFTRQVGSATNVSMSVGIGGVMIVAYQNVSGVGAVGAFVESSGATVSPPSITPQNANSVVLGIVSDRNAVNPVPPASFTSRSSFAMTNYGNNISERFFGSTAPTGTHTWTQNTASGLAAVGVLVELKPGTLTVARGLEALVAFAPAVVSTGEVSVLTITLTNTTETAITGAAFTDNYPAGLVNAPVPNAVTTCSGGTTSAAASGASLALSDATVPALGSCTVTANVTSASAGTFVNSIGVISSSAALISGPSASLTVLTPPVVGVTFSPVSIGINAASTLTVTLGNSNAMAITGTGISVAYPAGLVNAAVPSATTTCSGGIVTAASGGGILELVDGTIPSSGSCTVTVSVTSGALGNYTIDIPIGSVRTAVAGSNAAAASATLAVTAAPPSPQFRSSSSRTGSGTLAFPAGSLASDWLVMYAVSHVTVPTPSGWTQSKVFQWSPTYAYYSYVFTRQVGSATSVSVSVGIGGAMMVAYQNVSGVGAVGAFVESSGATVSPASITPQNANSVVLGIVSDRDPVNPVPPVSFTSRASFAMANYGNNISERLFGSTAPTGAPTWTQSTASSLSAVGVLIELKP